MQELTVVSRLFPLIVSGEKRSTIQWRETRIELGSMLYVCADNPHDTIVVNVIRCTDIKLMDAARFLGREAEWPPAIMLEGMREHYQTITLDDVVQIIEHEPMSNGLMPLTCPKM